MRKRLICAAALVLAILIIPGCSKKSVSQSTAESKVGNGAYNSQSQSLSIAKDSALKSEAPGVENKDSGQLQKKIIQTGDISIIVEDLKKTSTDISNKVNEFGGYVESESISELSSNSRLRVPSEKLQAFIEFLEKNYDVQGKNFATQDITDAYVDNDARLRNLKAQEAQVLEIMKKANNVEDILKVQSELSKVRGEIEALESKKKVWDRNVDFSSVMIMANKKQTAIESKVKALTGSEFIKSIGKGFTNSTIGLILFLQNTIIFVVSNILIIAIIAAASVLVYKKYLKNKIRK